MRVLFVIGTRPEAIKLAPVIRALKREKGFSVRVCVTAQHRDILDPMLTLFAIRPDIDLDLMRRDQTPPEVLSRVLRSLDPVLAAEKPGLVLVQGDTTTALAAALAAYYRGIAVAHVEAGLRSFDSSNPYPEEINRVLIDKIADLLFAPMPGARKNLLREGIPSKRIILTGNTVVDALEWALARSRKKNRIPGIGPDERIVVVTLHRRESYGRPFERIFKGIEKAADIHPDLTWVYPVHPNPNVRRQAERLRHPRVKLLKPLGYLDFIGLMNRSEFVVTDSGGVQEEAPSLGKPVILVREKTERPELLKGMGIMVGQSPERLVAAVARVRRLKPKKRNLFGDGKASARIVKALRRLV